MKFPKVRFEKFSIEDNLDCLVYYSHPENSEHSPLDFYKFTVTLFPELEGKIGAGMSDEEVYMVLDKEVRPTLEKFYNNSLEDKKYQEIWDKVNDSIMEDLGRVLEVELPSDKEITCRLCLLPVCSRDIEGKTFDINYGTNEETLIETGIHEICHMFYFEKWKEIYPDYKEEEFDNPHIAWYLSEAMIDPLINNETFRKYTNGHLGAYSVFYETIIDGKSVIETLREYVRDNPIDVAIKKGYEFFLKNESIIKR